MSGEANQYWPFWLGGLALAAVPVVHWLLLGRMFAVSGRYTALNDALRVRLERWRAHEDAPDESGAMTDEEMAAAMREATAAAFGEAAAAVVEEPVKPRKRGYRAPQSSFTHLLFFVGAVGGAALAALYAHQFAPGGPPMGAIFARIFGEGPAVTASVLFGGGLLVGFGTRMSGGCTSGHGLCGVSRLQPGSLVATAAFFGTGIAVSFGLALLVAGGN